MFSKILPDQTFFYHTPTSFRLGIMEFTVPSEAPVNFLAMIDTITNSKTVTFSQHMEDIPQKPHYSSDHKAKHIIKQHFQDHLSTVTPTQDHLLAPFQDHKQPIFPFQGHKVQIVPLSQDHLTTVDIRDIIVLKHAFSTSFDTTGNMPGEYTIYVDPSVPPVQHVCRKVLIETREEIEKAL